MSDLLAKYREREAADFNAVKAARACAGLDLPDNVSEGAVTRLVDAAKSWAKLPAASGLRAALRELGVKE